MGIDALLAQQTRGHGDLDLAIDAARLPEAIGVFEHLGYHVVVDQTPTRLELHGPAGMLDLHPVARSTTGAGTQELLDGSVFAYPADGFTTGVIAGIEVRCLTAPLQIESHTGYEPGDNSYRNMEALARAGHPVPAPYAVRSAGERLR